jgi:predicted ABC-type ATPase
VADIEGFVHIDPDSIKKVMPEYPVAVGQRAKNAASLVHEESALLAERLRDHARDQGKNFIFEGIGRDPVYYGAMIDDLKAHGYEVQIVMTHVEDADKAVERSNVRGEKSGRWVAESFIRAMVPLVPKSFAQLHHKVDAFAVFDTEEFPAKLAWTRRGDQEVVPDPELKDRLTRGELRPRAEPPPRREAKEAPGSTAPPDVPLERTIAAFLRAFERDHAEMELTPRRFRKEQGIQYPSDDPFTKIKRPKL